MSRKDVQKILKAARKRGWRDISHTRKRNGHYFYEWEDGTRIFAPFSPSDHRGVQNLERDLRRIEQGLDTRREKLYGGDK